MTAVGPVCHIPPKTTTFAKTPVPIPAIPPPAQPTLASLVATVNTLRQIIMITTGQNGTNGQNGQNGGNGGAGGVASPPGGSFQQTSVTNQTVRVFQNNDPTSDNWVDVQYVSQLVMGNNATRSTWTYDALPPPA